MLRARPFFRPLAIGALALFAFAQPASADDFCVDTDGELQAALTTAAANGVADSIRVVQGAYTGPFDYTSSERYALSVLGGYAAGCATRTLDAANTTLQGDGADRVLGLTATNGGAFTVEGVTISGGVRTGDGGGLYASTISNITLRDNVIQDNTATVKGGGAYIASEGTMYVERNTFSTNGGTQDTDQGGGLFVFTDHGTLAMTGNTFNGNVAYANGAGAMLDTALGTLTLTDNVFENGRVYVSWCSGAGIFINVRNTGRATLVGNDFSSGNAGCYGGYAGGAYLTAPSGGAVTLTNNRFDGNTSGSEGGGVVVSGQSGATTLIENTFSGNIAGGIGGGARVGASTGAITLTDNRFDINRAGANGGGAYVSTTSGAATLTGNVFYTNNAAHGGAAWVQTAGIATLTNNTLENNAGSIDGGGLWLTATSEAEIASLYNNLFWNNHAPVGGDLWINNNSDGDTVASPLDLMHNNFNQTPNTGYWTKVAITIDPTNLDLNPLFDDTDTQHLSASSPMIDAGDSTAPALPDTDIDGEERVIGATVDIGADEFAYSAYRLTVAKSGTGSGTVTSNPAGINCGTDCSEDYPSGTSVTLTATPAVGSVFTGWSGACTGTGTCNLTMDAAKSVTATFVQVTLTINNVTKAEGNSGTTPFAFTVTLSRASTTNVTVNWGTANGTATVANGDYAAASGTLTFTPGQLSKTVTVNVVGDTTKELNETFFVNLTSPVGATLLDGQGLGTILNDDGPVLTINDVSKAEGNSGITAFTFTVTLSPASASEVRVNYATANGTATAGSDYTAVSGTLIFSAGQTSKTVTVPVIGDTVLEPNETFTLRLSAPVGATVFDGVGLGTILNDEGPVLRISNVTKAEGNSGTTPFTFTVSLSPASAGTVTVKYATANDTATAGSDYTAANGTLTFAPGQTSLTVTVNVIGDTIMEPNETFFVNLSSPSGATLFDGQGLGTILNDEGPVLRINDVSKAEGNSGTTPFTFTVSLSPASASTVTVSYATANGTATVAAGDYLRKIGSLTFAPGVTSQMVTVDVIGDTNREANETFFVNLSGATGATLFDSQGKGTILDDDNVDFLVTSIVFTPSSPVADGTFSAAVTVKNQGTAGGDGGYLDIWLDQSTVQTCPADGNAYKIVGVVEAGASKVFTFTGLRSGTAGTKTFRAFVDSYCQTPEANEGNNQATKSYTVLP